MNSLPLEVQQVIIGFVPHDMRKPLLFVSSLWHGLTIRIIKETESTHLSTVLSFLISAVKESPIVQSLTALQTHLSHTEFPGNNLKDFEHSYNIFCKQILCSLKALPSDHLKVLKADSVAQNLFLFTFSAKQFGHPRYPRFSSPIQEMSADTKSTLTIDRNTFLSRLPSGKLMTLEKLTADLFDLGVLYRELDQLNTKQGPKAAKAILLEENSEQMAQAGDIEQAVALSEINKTLASTDFGSQTIHNIAIGLLLGGHINEAVKIATTALTDENAWRSTVLHDICWILLRSNRKDKVKEIADCITVLPMKNKILHNLEGPPTERESRCTIS